MEFDWQEARHMLNGRLSKIEGALEKGKRLLLEALHADPTHDEARLYLGFVLYRHREQAACGSCRASARVQRRRWTR